MYREPYKPLLPVCLYPGLLQGLELYYVEEKVLRLDSAHFLIREGAAST